jgi:ribonucleoside-diphosphate reductase beta chain
LPWLDEILNGVEHTNFFENRVTEYTKAATTGSWEDVFDSIDKASNAGQASLFNVASDTKARD